MAAMFLFNILHQLWLLQSLNIYITLQMFSCLKMLSIHMLYRYLLFLIKAHMRQVTKQFLQQDTCYMGSCKLNYAGMICWYGMLQVEAFKRITLSKLPSVLILHLKRFLFNQTGGSQKLSKEISYPLELEIPKGLFHVVHVYV